MRFFLTITTYRNQENEIKHLMSYMESADLFWQLYSKIELFTNSSNWRIKLIIACTFFSLFLATPAYHYLPTAMLDENWVAFTEKVNHPLTQSTFNENTHAAKKVFRLTVPVLAKITFLNNWGVFALQFIINLLFLFFTIKLIEKITADRVAAAFTTIGLTFIYAGHAGFTDINTWFDNFAFFFLLLSMFSSRAVLIFIFIQLACWTDERAFFACSLVFIFMKIREISESDFKWKSAIKISPNSFAVVVSILFYIAGRMLLTHFTGLTTPTGSIGLKVLINQTQFYGMGIWTALEGFWILIIITLLLLWFKRQYLLLIMIGTATTVSLLISFMVFDITRSSAYIFPLIFVSISLLKNNLTIENMRKLLLISATVCFLFPAYYIITDVYPYTLWYKPLFIRVIDLLKINQL